MATFLPHEYSRVRPETVGFAAPVVDLKLDDAANDSGVGEPLIRGPNIVPGYWNKPEATAAAIDPAGWFHTGDVGYFDAGGYLHLCDRKRDMVISGGVNIYPAEIESVLVNMPDVADGCVFGIPDDEFGEKLMAVVQPMPGKTLDPQAIRAYLAEHLANYKVPSRIEIQNDLPREDSGKIFKRRLREPFWEGREKQIS